MYLKSLTLCIRFGMLGAVSSLGLWAQGGAGGVQGSPAPAATAVQAAPAADTLYFSNGDQATGKIISMEKDSLVLETTYAGSVTIRTESLTRVVVNGQEFPSSALDQLSAAIAARIIASHPPAAEEKKQEDAAAHASDLAISRKPFLKQVSGTVGLGTSLHQATSVTRGLQIDVNLYRASLDKVGQAPRSETGAIFSQSFSQFQSHGSPAESSESFNLDLSHAVRLRGKFSTFGLASYDHSSSEGLKLLQLYGGGLSYTGWNKNGNRFEVRGGLDMTSRSNLNPKLDHTLVGYLFEEIYAKTFRSGMVLREQYLLDRAISHSENVDGKGNIALDAPVSSFLALRFSLNHRYMNVIPKGDKRHAFELSAGIDLTISNGKTASMKGGRRKIKKKR